MTRILRTVSAWLVLPALLACNDQGPPLDFTWVELARSGVGSLGSDSVNVIGADSAIIVDGVMYAIASWSCAPFNTGGERSGTSLSLRVTARTSPECVRVQTRLAYRATIRTPQAGTYQLQVLHREPDTPERNDRVVFQGSVVLP
jgi:hypothetical protein